MRCRVGDRPHSGRQCGICVAITGDSEPDVSEEDRRFGFHCLDPWDGNHNGFERLVKPYLNDPSSMETHSTRMGALGTRPNGHSIVMEFGARNAFGGMVRHNAIGSVDNETCEATLESVNDPPPMVWRWLAHW